MSLARVRSKTAAIQPRKQQLSAGTTQKLTEAFDLAWPQIMLEYGGATDIQCDTLRMRLANFIVACACRGEFEPEKLVQTALRAFTTRRAA